MAKRRSRLALRKEQEEQFYRNLLKKGKQRHEAQRSRHEIDRVEARRSRPFTKLGFPFVLAKEEWFSKGMGQHLIKFRKHFYRSPKGFPWQSYLRSYWRTSDIKELTLELLRYLFVRYEMPDFMFEAFTDARPRLMDWFLRLAKGHSPRSLPGLPFPLTHKMAAFFMDGSPFLGIGQNLRMAQVLGLGGSEALGLNLAKGNLGEFREGGFSEHRELFYKQLILWLIQHNIQDLQDLRKILWYVDMMKFSGRRPVGRNRMADLLPPPKPNLEMKGRKPEKLMAEASELYEIMRLKGAFFQNHILGRVGEFRQSMGDNGTYRIVPLIDRVEIRLEGNEMRHCIASYTQKVEIGVVSVWSMTLKRDKMPQKRLLTILVNDRLQISQARGFANRTPKGEEMGILRNWAKAEGLVLLV